MSSVETGQMSAVETGQMSAAETGQMSAVETRQMLKSQIRGWSFSLNKKAPAASWLAATGLVKSRVVIFTEKKRLRQAS